MCDDSGWMSSGPNMNSSAALQRGEADDGLRVLGLQQVLHHVEHEQRPHAVVGEALPHLGGEEKGQPARMAEQFAGFAGARPMRRSPEQASLAGAAAAAARACAAAAGGRAAGFRIALAARPARWRRRGRRRTRCRAPCRAAPTRPCAADGRRRRAPAQSRATARRDRRTREQLVGALEPRRAVVDQRPAPRARRARPAP